jgi:PAS domain S-box-containing protein
MLNQLGILFENLEQSITLIDENYVVLYVNKKGKQLGEELIDKELAPGISLMDMLSEEMRKNIINYLTLASIGNGFTYDKQLKLKDGRIRWFRIHFANVDWEAEKRARYIITLFEITNEMVLQEKLFKKTAEVQAILSCIPDLLFKLKKDGTFLEFVGGPVADLYEHPESFIGKNVIDVMPREIGEINMAAIQECMRDKKMTTFRYTLPLNNSLRYYIAKLVPLNDNELLVSCQDVTAEKEAEVKVKQSEEKFRKLFEETKEQKERIEEQNIVLSTLSDRLVRKITQLEEFSYIVTHNLRKPVNNLRGLVAMQEQVEDKEEKDRINGLVRNSILLLSDMLNELGDVLKVRQIVEIERNILVFEEVFTKIRNQQAALIDELGATIESAFEVSDISFPSIYLESIFLNLLSNSLKYNSPKRRLEVHVKTYLNQQNQVVLQFSDNGLGLDMEKFGDKIFKMYKTFHGNPDSKGLGLFLTKSQVESQGGNIEVRSVVDKGTSFYITFSN